MNLNTFIALTILCWGVWGIFDKKALEKANYLDVILTLYLTRLVDIPLILIVLSIFVPGWHLGLEVMLWSSLACLSIAIATIAYTIALSECEASYVLGITSAYNVITQFIAVLILRESLVGSRVLGACLITAGIVIIGGSGSTRQHLPSGPKKALVIGSLIVATFLWGLFGIFDKKAVSIAHPFEVALAQGLCDIFVFLLLWLCFRARGHCANLENLRTWRFCFGSALSWVFGNICYFFALAQSTASYAIAITSCYPLVMYFFALAILKERFNRVRLAGILLVTLGSILVQHTQSIS